MMMESVVVLMYSLVRMEKILGKTQFETELKINPQMLSFFSHLIRNQIYHKSDELAVHIISETQMTERFAKLSMIFKALTFNRSILKHNFHPYISDIIIKLMKLTKAMLQDLDYEKP